MEANVFPSFSFSKAPMGNGQKVAAAFSNADYENKTLYVLSGNQKINENGENKQNKTKQTYTAQRIQMQLLLHSLAHP